MDVPHRCQPTIVYRVERQPSRPALHTLTALHMHILLDIRQHPVKHISREKCASHSYQFRDWMPVL
ncbi:MAG: hypothetical protein ACRDHW_06570, partial [Ktedonobacteraceae bacterium]